MKKVKVDLQRDNANQFFTSDEEDVLIADNMRRNGYTNLSEFARRVLTSPITITTKINIAGRKLRAKAKEIGK